MTREEKVRRAQLLSDATLEVDSAVHCRGTIAAGKGAGEQLALPPNLDRTQRPLICVVVCPEKVYCKLIDDREDTDASTITEFVANEVGRPALVQAHVLGSSVDV